MNKILLYIIAGVIFCLGCGQQPPTYQASSVIIECENFNQGSGLYRIEEKPNASEVKCVHIGPDTNDVDEGIGSTLSYNVDLEDEFLNAVLEMNYSEDAGGNIIQVYCDDNVVGCFRTQSSGGWDSFILENQKISLGNLKKGKHVIEFAMTKGGSWGVILDCFKIFNIQCVAREYRAYGYVKSLVNPTTGLVRSAFYDANFTTIYKNALSAMCFLHQNDIKDAEKIFDFFKSKYDPAMFTGFNKNWDAESGSEGAADYWVGDNCFLLLSLEYYVKKTGDNTKYGEMTDGLVKWIASKATDDIIAEGLADMYSALLPFKDKYAGMEKIIETIRNKFYANSSLPNVLDHIERAALCFDDTSGFQYTGNFRRTEQWMYDGKSVELLSAFSWDDYANVEISLQMLLAWKIKKKQLTCDLSYLSKEVDKIWLLSGQTSEEVNMGLPYFLSDTNHGWNSCYDEPIVDTACYMLFYYWGFDPMNVL